MDFTQAEIESAGIEWSTWVDPESWGEKEKAFFWEYVSRSAAQKDVEIRESLCRLLPGTPACWSEIMPKLEACLPRIAELAARIRLLELALADIVTSAGECDVSNSVGVPLVSVDNRLIETARKVVNTTPRK